jgi:hypothetical protein
MAHPPDQLQYTFSIRMFFEGDFTVTHSSCMTVSPITPLPDGV